jgi:DNA adenine methylase
MDFSKKTRVELIAICKEKNIKGYSGKNKEAIVKLLSSATNTFTNEIVTTLNKNPSPLRYPGGKTRAIHIIYEYINEHFPHRKQLLSPFFGGGSLELFLSVNGYNVFGNDLFIPLYNFWITKQKACETLIAKLKENMTISKDKFHELRNSIMTEPDNIKQATSYFIINRTSFSGATLCGGFSEEASKGRFTESSIKKLRECNVNSIVFSNLDCNKFIDEHPETTNTIIYADPPYYIEKFIYGKDGDMHENFNHVKFSETMLKRKDWIISYNDCEYIRKLYDGCRISTAKWSYGMNKSKSSSEIIILPPVM